MNIMDRVQSKYNCLGETTKDQIIGTVLGIPEYQEMKIHIENQSAVFRSMMLFGLPVYCMPNVGIEFLIDPKDIVEFVAKKPNLPEYLEEVKVRT